MGSKIQERLAPGIYKLANGMFRVKVAIGNSRQGERQHETTFPAGAGLREMKGWQTDHRAALRRQQVRVAKGSLQADATIYLARADVKALTSHKTRICDIAAWYPRFGNMLRHLITPEQIADEMEEWHVEGVAVWTRRHRLNALRDLFTKLDGEDAHNPARAVKQPKKPAPVPHALDYEVIRTTLATMEPCATKALLMVMAFCGFRPVEVKRIAPHMIRLDAIAADSETGELKPQPFVVRPSAKGGDVVAVPLSGEGVEAWKLWLATNEWDAQTQKWKMASLSNANRDWKKAMARVRAKLLKENKVDEAARYWPVRCYSLVHSYCTTLLVDGDADITVVQKARGHRDVRTTQIYTTMKVDTRIERTVKRAFERNARWR